jgi:hypothetical protein
MPSKISVLALAGLLPVLTPVASIAAPAAPVDTKLAPADVLRLQTLAKRVTILRDKWGSPHVYGKTDADAVFGMLYAQAEDDFNRVEMNFIVAMGRVAEVEGEKALYDDLRMKLFIRPADLQAQYKASPAWLKQLMVAWADGLNWYLHTHPQVKPKLLTRFEPWMALSFSEGSIGGDIEDVDVPALKRFYDDTQLHADGGSVVKRGELEKEPAGSNGFAIAPALSHSGRALLMINPHTSFYFRPEIHVNSAQGLNAYGAVTWGQFFVYQGFNDRIGWMHTSGGGDVIDEFLETVTEKDGKYYYQYGKQQREVKAVEITLPYKTGTGMAEKKVTAYFTHHGPVVRREGAKWVSVALMNDPLKALQQSFLRTKARDYKAFAKVMQLRTNSSNNTVYADADGNIAYWHGNFIPVRDARFDYTKPVDGSDPATDWKGLHAVKDTIGLFNPKNGWIQNTNNWPYSAAGAYSPRQQDYPAYMSVNPENARGIHAVRVLEQTGLHDRVADRRRLRHAADCLRAAAAAADPRLRRNAGQLDPEGRPGRPDRRAARLGHALCAHFRADVDRDLLAAGSRQDLHAGGQGAEHPRTGLSRHAHHAGPAARSADAGFDEAGKGLRLVAHAMGRDQPLPAPDRRHRAAVRRQQAQHPGALRVGQLGRAGGLWHDVAADDAPYLRRTGQQLRGGRRVRAAHSRKEHPGRRPERRPGVAAFHGPGGDVRARRIQGRAVLQGRHPEEPGAGIPARPVATQRRRPPG